MFNAIKTKTKQAWNWTKNQIKKIAIALGIVGIAVAVGTALPPDQPINPFLTIDGKLTEFVYTDDNTGEDLIIRTNRENYFNLGGNFNLYFSITNESGKDQQVKTTFSFDESDQKYVNAIQEYGGETVIFIPTSTIPAVINPKTGTSTPERIIPAQEIKRTIWTDMPISKKIISSSITRKDIKATAENKGNDFLLKSGETKFFKAKIAYTDFANREEFFIEAFGSMGGYGHLDPWTYTQLFNTLTDGSINAQDSWVGAAVIQTTTKYEGAKALSFSSGQTAERTLAGNESTAGTWYFAFNVDIGTGYQLFLFMDGNDSNSIYFKFDQGSPVNLKNYVTSWTTLETTIAENVWYKMEIVYVGSSDSWKYRLRKEGEAWGAQSASLGTYGTVAEIDRLGFHSGSDAVVYLDSLGPNEPQLDVPAAPPSKPGQVIIIEEE